MKLAHQTGRVGQGNEHTGKSHGRECAGERDGQLHVAGEKPHSEAVAEPVEQRLGQERDHVARLTQGSKTVDQGA